MFSEVRHDPSMRFRASTIGLLLIGTTAAVLGPILLATHADGFPGDYVLCLAFFLAGGFAVVRAPTHRASAFLLVVGTLLLAAWVGGYLISIAYVRFGTGSLLWLANAGQQLVEGFALAAFIGLFAVLPDGRYHHRYEQAVVRVAFLVASAVPVLAVLTMPVVPTRYWVWAHPIVASPLYLQQLSWLAPIPAAVISGSLLALPIAVILLALRYRGLDAGQRLQVRWVLIAGAILPAGIVTTITLAWLTGLAIPKPLLDWLFEVALGAVPVGIVMSIVRYRLLDVDRFLRRSVVFAILWLAILLLYAGLAGAVGLLTGQRLPLGAAVLLTILVAVAFQPARSRLERLTSQLLFGQPADGYDTVRSLGAALERAGGVQDVGTTLATTVRRGLGSAWARVSLASESGSGGSEVIGSDGIAAGDQSAAEVAVPVSLGNAVIGTIECGPRLSGHWTCREGASRNHRPAGRVGDQELEAERGTGPPAEPTRVPGSGAGRFAGAHRAGRRARAPATRAQPPRWRAAAAGCSDGEARPRSRPRGRSPAGWQCDPRRTSIRCRPPARRRARARAGDSSEHPLRRWPDRGNQRAGRPAADCGESLG